MSSRLKRNVENYDERVNFIIEQRLRAVKNKAELRAAYTKEFGSAEGFTKILELASEVIDQYYNRDTEAGTAELVMHFWSLYERSLEMNDIAECRRILVEIHKITILKPPAGKEAEVLDIFARPQKAVVNK